MSIVLTLTLSAYPRRLLGSDGHMHLRHEVTVPTDLGQRALEVTQPVRALAALAATVSQVLVLSLG